MFHAATSVLLSLGVERKSHKALIAAFSEFVVRKGLISEKYHNFFHKAYEAREDADYLSIPRETNNGAKVMLERAVEFVAACKKFMEGRNYLA
jgi:uncharacterized protein (UPF0332 family)